MITLPSSTLRAGVAAGTVAVVLAGALTATSAEPARAAGPDPDVVSVLQGVPDGRGSTALLTPRDGAEVPLPEGLSRSAGDPETARAYLDAVAPALGVDASDDGLRDLGTAELFDGTSVTRYQQYADGIPVLGGQLVVALDADGRLESAGGETSPRLDDPRVSVSAARATSVAVRAAAKALGAGAATLRALAEPARYVNDPDVTGQGRGAAHVVWRVVVGPQGLPLDGGAVVLVDARDASVLSVTPTARHAVDRAVCDRANTYVKSLYLEWECDGAHFGGYDRTEGGAASGIAQVDAAYDNLGSTHDYFKTVLGVDLVDGSGFPRGDGIAWNSCDVKNGQPCDGERLRASVRYCLPLQLSSECRDTGSMFNAFWLDLSSGYRPGVDPYPGGAMFIGDGFAQALDVIAHEISHGATAATAGLEYEDEAGAINESMADVFGELAEQWTNGPDSQWVIGQDVTGTQGLRSMRSPTTFFCKVGSKVYDCRQPDSLRSPHWDVDEARFDNGGVHTNSGVGNKAAYLMTRGGSFGGRVVAPISPDPQRAIVKTSRVWWKAQHLLTPSSDYHDLALALHQACVSLAASGATAAGEKFTYSNCTASVDSATLATQMGATKFSVTLSKRKAQARSRVVVRSTLSGLRGSFMGGVRVELQHRVAGTSRWRTVARKSTSGRGRAEFRVKAARTGAFRVVYRPAGGGVPTVVSPRRRLAVSAKVGRTVRGKELSAGQRFVVKGKVRPASPGRKVRLQARLGGKWRTQATARIRKGSTYRFSQRPPRGVTRWRVLKPRQKTLAKGASRTFTVRVR